MRLILGYDCKVPKNTIKSGWYNKSNCGGECSWYITTSHDLHDDLNKEYIGSIEYHNERYFYLFQYIDKNHNDSTLFSYMKSFPTTKLTDDTYIFLTNEPMRNYNHKLEIITVDGEDDMDLLGGNIVYSNLE